MRTGGSRGGFPEGFRPSAHTSIRQLYSSYLRNKLSDKLVFAQFFLNLPHKLPGDLSEFHEAALFFLAVF